MRTPIRFQSRLLVRRSYKPGRASRRALGIKFRPAARFTVKIAEQNKTDAPAPDAEVFAYSI